MEEVWKDINLSSLHDQHSRSHDFSVSTPMNLQVHQPPHHHHHHHHAATANFRNIILQDFLSSSASKDSAPPTCILSAPIDTPLFSSTVTSQPQPAAPPTVLSLNSSQELHFIDNPSHLRSNLHSQVQPISNVTFHSSFDQVMGSPTSGLPSFGKKRDSDCSNPSDRRQKRMIKNRESAARSRARKQAYTNELELEVAHLMEENARLKRQQEQLRIAAAAQVPKKYRLHRTSTAPF